jgi:tRNA pseudouridine55 synthase
MDGVLLIDKPAGPTSHDVVARIRRATGQRTVGHTGTLDPRATGLLPLVLGRATRLAGLLTAGDKTYEAWVRLGFATDTDDAEGAPIVGDPGAALPGEHELQGALERFRGEFEQTPPAHSAKKVGGVKAYELARRSRPVDLRPVMVTVRRLELLGRAGDIVQLRVTATSGFYVRALARDLGARLGCGGHLADLRRTGSGPFSVTDAVPLEQAEALGAGLVARLVSPAESLPHLTAVSVTPSGLKRALHGNALGPEHLEGHGVAEIAPGRQVRILAADGHLVALAQKRGGALHPVVVLG